MGVLVQDYIDTFKLQLNLNEVVNIRDEILKRIIKEELDLSSNTITVRDMYKLTTLNCKGEIIKTLEGLQYAKNLETLNADWGEIKDLTPLKVLKKLSNISIINQYIAVGMADEINGKVVIKEDILDINGERIMPKEIVIGHITCSKSIDISSVLIDGTILIDSSNFKSGVNSIALMYESLCGKYKAQTLYII